MLNISPLLKQYGHSALYVLVAKFVSIIGHFVVLAVLNDVFDKTVFGQFMFFLSICLFLSGILISFFNNLILFYLPSDNHHHIKQTAIWLGGLVAFVIVIIVCGVALFFDQPIMTLVLIIPFYTLTMVTGKIYHARQEISNMAIVQDIIPSFIRITGLIVWYLFLPHAIETVSVIYIASYIIPFIVYAPKMIDRPHMRYFFLSLWDIKHGGVMAVSNIMRQSSGHIVTVLTGILGGALMVADYTVAMRLAQLVMLPKNMMAQLLIPRIRKFLSEDKRASLLIEHNTIRNITMVFTIIGAIVLVLIGPVLLTLFGDYKEAYPLLIILCLNAITHAAFLEIGWFLPMLGQAHKALISYILGFVTFIIFLVIGVPIWGVEAIGVAIICNTAITFATMYGILRHVYTLDLATQALWVCLSLCLGSLILLVCLH